MHVPDRVTPCRIQNKLCHFYFLKLIEDQPQLGTEKDFDIVLVSDFLFAMALGYNSGE